MQFSKNCGSFGPCRPPFPKSSFNKTSSLFPTLSPLPSDLYPLPSKLVGAPGLEPGTSSLSGTRSNQLSYTPGVDPKLVEPDGIEPTTS